VQFIYLRFLLQWKYFSSFFRLSFLFLQNFSPFWPANSFGQGINSVCYLQILILIVIHIYVLCGFFFSAWATSSLPPFTVRVQCTCQSLIEGKIAAWLSLSLSLSRWLAFSFFRCCMNATYFPDDLAKVTATSFKQSESQRKEIIYTLSKYTERKRE